MATFDSAPTTWGANDAGARQRAGLGGHEGHERLAEEDDGRTVAAGGHGAGAWAERDAGVKRDAHGDAVAADRGLVGSEVRRVLQQAAGPGGVRPGWKPRS